jgi:hypothetical protein
MLNFGEWQMYCEQGGIGSAVVYVHWTYPEFVDTELSSILEG